MVDGVTATFNLPIIIHLEQIYMAEWATAPERKSPRDKTLVRTQPPFRP
jgi:hypothetical protein